MSKKIKFLLDVRFIIPLILIVVLVIIFYPDTKARFYLDNKYYNDVEGAEGNFIEVNTLPKGTYLVYVYANVCIFPSPCDEVFKEVMDKYGIDMLEISYDDLKKTKYHDKVLYAPSVMIIYKGTLKAYLDAESDEDLEKYQDASKFEEWLEQYVILEK